MIFLDTNILIEVLKGDSQTTQRVEAFEGPLAISAITAMELVYGARNKVEVQRLERFLGLFQLVHLDKSISTSAMRLVTGYAKSHTLDIPDALIAATAIEYQANLFTYNQKDFRFIPNLQLI